MSDNTVIDGVDYGPLALLVGNWRGEKGLDTAPEPDGKEENPYYETLMFEAIGDVSNAESQTLAVLRYHQVVSRKSNDKVFHNETGYWMWDAKSDVVSHSLTIPRGVCVLAGGSAEIGADGQVTLRVRARSDDPDWGIIQAPFMRDNAKTLAFEHTVTVSGNTLSYSETMSLDIYGKPFEHTDTNELSRD